MCSPAGALLHLCVGAVGAVWPARVGDSGIQRGHEGCEAGGGCALVNVAALGVKAPEGDAGVADAPCPNAGEPDARAEAALVFVRTAGVVLQGTDFGGKERKALVLRVHRAGAALAVVDLLCTVAATLSGDIEQDALCTGESGTVRDCSDTAHEGVIHSEGTLSLGVGDETEIGEEGEGVEAEVVHDAPHFHGDVGVAQLAESAGGNEGTVGPTGGLPLCWHEPGVDLASKVGDNGKAERSAVDKGEPVQVGITNPLAAHDPCGAGGFVVESNKAVLLKVTVCCVGWGAVLWQGVELAEMVLARVIGKAVECAGGISAVPKRASAVPECGGNARQ